MTGTELEPVAYSGELTTRGDIRQDLRDRKTDSWTDVLGDVVELSKNIAQTQFVPKDLRNSVPAVASAIMYGREIGMAPMMALQNLHVIEGKPSLSAEGQRALILQAGHEFVVAETSGAKCTVKGRRSNSQEWTTVTWTIDDARQAGLLGKNNWKSYPRQMLLARASAELARIAFPDVIRGLMASEELEDVMATNPAPEPEGTGEGSTSSGTTVKRRARKTAAKKAEKVDAAPEPDREPAPLPDEEQPTDDAAPGSTGSGSRGSTGQPSGAVSPDPDAPTPSGDQVAEGGNSVGGSDANLTSTSEPSPPPADDPAPLPEDDEPQAAPAEEDEPVEGEVVDNAAPGTISQGQQKAMHAQFNRLGKQPREHRLIATRALIGRDVESSNDLSYDEAKLLLTALESCRKWNDLAAMAEDAEKVRNSTDGTGA